MNAKAHFHVLGIPVRIEPFFWIAAVLLAYNLGDARLILMWVAVVLVSVLVHELGHAVALKAFGQSSAIVLHGFGGLTFSQRKLDRARSIAVTLAGPLAALVLLGIPAMLLRDSDYGVELSFDYQLSDQVFGIWPVIVFVAYVNIWWSIANLLPIRPLDGGNVLTELVGIQPARLVSIVVGTAAAVWAYTHTDAFRYAAFFAGFLVLINVSEYRKARQGVRAPSAFDVEGPPVPGGGGARPGEHGGPARARPEHPAPRRGGRPTGPPAARPDTAPAPGLPGGIDAASGESMVWNLLRRGDVPGARRVLSRVNGAVSPFVPATVAVAAGEGTDALVDAYLARPSGPANLVPASTVSDAGAAPELARRLVDAGPSGVEAAAGLQTHLHYADRFADAAAVGELVHGAAGASRAQVAFDTACAWSRAGDPERGLAWVSTALDDGFHAPGLLDGEPDLEAVRARPGWPDVRARLT
ncbi:MAG TPA: M50 family metallopeptidase [Acidimicrobiales bacterium]|nr:M50 family metallopeptidase [Acidimicrobiales bacterium]